MPARIERPGAQQWVPDGADVDGLAAAAPACRGCELWGPATQAVRPGYRLVGIGAA